MPVRNLARGSPRCDAPASRNRQGDACRCSLGCIAPQVVHSGSRTGRWRHRQAEGEGDSCLANLSGRASKRIVGDSPIEQGDMMEAIHEPSDGGSSEVRGTSARFLRLGAIGGAALAAGAITAKWVPDLRQRGLLSADGAFDAASIAWADSLYDEEFPTSPLILNPFSVELPIPQALRPEPYGDWTYWNNVPGPGTAGRTRTATTGPAVVRRLAGRRRDDSVGVPDRVEGGGALVHHLAGVADQFERSAEGFLRPVRQAGRRGPGTCRRARSTASTGRSRDR